MAYVHPLTGQDGDREDVARQHLPVSPKVVSQRIRLDADGRDFLEGGARYP